MGIGVDEGGDKDDEDDIAASTFVFLYRFHSFGNRFTVPMTAQVTKAATTG